MVCWPERRRRAGIKIDVCRGARENRAAENEGVKERERER